MSVEYVLHPKLGLVFFRCHGAVTLKNTLAAFLGVISDPGFLPKYHFLVDHTHSRFPNATYQNTTRLVRLLRPNFAARDSLAKTALYCPADEAFGVSRLYETVSGVRTQRRLLVCRTKVETLAYLELDPHDTDVWRVLWPEDMPNQWEVTQ